MDSAPATHDDTGDKLDLVLDALAYEPGIQSGLSIDNVDLVLHRTRFDRRRTRHLLWT